MYVSFSTYITYNHLPHFNMASMVKSVSTNFRSRSYVRRNFRRWGLRPGLSRNPTPFTVTKFRRPVSNSRPLILKRIQSLNFLGLCKESTQDRKSSYEPHTSNTKTQNIRWNPVMHQFKDQCFQKFLNVDLTSCLGNIDWLRLAFTCNNR